MTTARDTVTKLTVAVGLMFAGVLALVLILSRAAAVVTSADDAITDDYAPSVVSLDAMLVDVRRVQDLVAERARRPTTSPAAEVQIAAARRALERDTATYIGLPADPGEKPLIAAIQSSLERFNDTVDRLLASGPGAGAKDPTLLSDFDAARLALDADIDRSTDFNADLAERAAARSDQVARTLIPTAAILGIVSVLSAAGVIALAYRTVVRSEKLAAESRRALLRRAEELEAFGGRVAHDLLSPLATVGLALDLAKRNPGSSDPRTAAILTRATNTLERVRRFVGDLLEFARAGAAPPPGVRTGVGEIVYEVTEEYLPIAREANAELEVKETTFSIVKCSPGVLTSLLSNLVQNAIKYLGDARVRKIEVRACEVGSEVRLEVKDSGPGIAEEVQDRLFEPFTRGEAGTTSGLGMGLATVRKLAEAHGGHAGVQSRPGNGSLFWVTLPVDR
jgi:signal transduction histidine kinase